VTAAARLALAGIVGAGVRLSAAEVAQLLAAFSRLRRVGEAELDAASDAKVAAAAERRATRPGRRVTKSPEPPLPPLFPGPVIVQPSGPMQIREDGTYMTRTFCTAEPAAAETYERKPGAMADALAQMPLPAPDEECSPPESAQEGAP